MKNIPIHPLAELFPAIPADEQQQLSVSIEEQGLLSPIVLFEGKILDGRHRYISCSKLGLTPKFIEYKGHDPVGYVVAANLNRRHLNESQRGIIAAKIATTTWGRTPSKDANLHLKPQVTREEAAEKMRVSERSVATASKIINEAPKRVVQAVTNGDLSLHAAEKIVKEKKSKSEDVLDATGYVVPEELVPIWNRRGEVLDLMKKIAGVEMFLKERQKEEDTLFSTVVFSDVISHLQFAHGELRASQIYAICVSCSGRGRKSCRHCKGRGFLSKQQWDMLPADVKQIRGAK